MLTLSNFKRPKLNRDYTYSEVSYKIGRDLIKRYGFDSAVRYLKNLGLTPEDTIEYLCFSKKGATNVYFSGR